MVYASEPGDQEVLTDEELEEAPAFVRELVMEHRAYRAECDLEKDDEW